MFLFQRLARPGLVSLRFRLSPRSWLGGVYGWNDWSYGPYERRYGGHRHHNGERIGVETGSGRTNGRVEMRGNSTTERNEIRGRSSSQRGMDTRSHSTTTGSGVTGSAPKADVQSEGAAKGPGGPTGEGAGARGGVSTGAGTSEGGKHQ